MKITFQVPPGTSTSSCTGQATARDVAAGNTEQLLVTISMMARLCSLSYRQVWTYMRTGFFPYYQLPINCKRLCPAECLTIIASHRVGPPRRKEVAEGRPPFPNPRA